MVIVVVLVMVMVIVGRGDGRGGDGRGDGDGDGDSDGDGRGDGDGLITWLIIDDFFKVAAAFSLGPFYKFVFKKNLLKAARSYSLLLSFRRYHVKSALIKIAHSKISH